MAYRKLYYISVGWAETEDPRKCVLHISEVTVFAFKAEILLPEQSQHSKLGLIRKLSVTISLADQGGAWAPSSLLGL